MPAVRIRGTDKVVFLPKHIGDSIIELKEYPDIDTVIRQEDKQNIGTYTDSDGTVLNTKNPQEVMLAGLANDFDGDVIMKAMGKRMSPLNERGVRSETHFTKNVSQVIEDAKNTN